MKKKGKVGSQRVRYSLESVSYEDPDDLPLPSDHSVGFFGRTVRINIRTCAVKQSLQVAVAVVAMSVRMRMNWFARSVCPVVGRFHVGIPFTVFRLVETSEYATGMIGVVFLVLSM